MMTTAEKVRALLDEKKEMRSEMLVYQQGQQNAVIALVVFFGSAAGLYLNPDLEQKFSIGYALFAAGQVVYFLSIYILSQHAQIATHAGYVIAIEKKINMLSDDKLTLWESVGSPRYAWRGHMLLAFVIMALMMIAAWGSCVFFTVTRLVPKAYLLVTAIESVLLFWLIVGSILERSRLAQNMEKEFALTREGKELIQASDATSQPAPSAAPSVHQG